MDEQVQTEPLGQTYTYNQDYHKMADFLGINIYDRSNDELAKKVSALADWAQNKTGKKDIHTTLTEVAKLQKSLGVHFIGRPLVTELYKHMRLSQDNALPQKAAIVNPPVKKAESLPKEAAPVGKIEQAIQKVVKQTITQAVKEAMK